MRLFICFLPLFIMLLTAPSGGAQPLTSSKRLGVQSRVLKGLSQKKIIELFGPPNRKYSSSQGSESWTYGSSIVFFTDGKVSAWSDSGELSHGQHVAAMQASHGFTGSNSFDSGHNPADAGELTKRKHWKNAWTPKQEISEKDVLDSIIDEENK